MKKTILNGILCAGALVLGAISLNAQQWTGSTAATGNISRTGNVGIGVTTPTENLEVFRGIKVSDGAAGMYINVDNTGNYTYFNSKYNAGFVRFDNTKPAGMLGFSYSDGALNYQSWGIGEGTLTQKFQITSGGNVGIGVNNPGNKLEVAGNIRATGDLFLFKGAEGQNADNGFLNIGSSNASKAWRIGQVSNGTAGNEIDKDLLFFRYNGSSTVSSLRFEDQTGRVHVTAKGWSTLTLPTISDQVRLVVEGTTFIGDIAPTTSEISAINSAINCTNGPKLKLFVNGTIGTKELRVNLTNWCDYVFDPSYKLKPLNEVESFIKTNKHLPEVPSEKEVVENGVAMGEMMKVHMKKIEELTLYMIELQKQNEKLAAEVAGLKK